MKLFIDECLSPLLSRHFSESGEHEAIHPRDYGRLGETDHQILERCLNEDRVIVTENAADFRKLVGRVPIHPGLVILPSVDRVLSLQLLRNGIAHLATLGNAADVIVNHVLEIDAAGTFKFYPLPA